MGRVAVPHDTARQNALTGRDGNIQLNERFRKKILDNMLVVLIGSEEKNSIETYQTDENRRGYMFSGEM